MPIKKTTTEGPKAKLMKQTIPALRKKAKALGVSDYTKRTKENLVQSIMLAEARKKRGTGMAGRKAKLKPVPQKKVGEYKYDKGGRWVKPLTAMPIGILNTPEHHERDVRIQKFKNSHTPSKADKGRFAMRPGKRISKNGNVYYEYRGNRADANIVMHGPGGREQKLSIDKWNVKTFLYEIDDDLASYDIQRTSVSQDFIDYVHSGYFDEIWPYAYYIDGSFYSTCFKCVAMAKIKYIQNEQDGFMDYTKYAIKQLRESVKNK